MAEPAQRLFFALWPPDEVARALHAAARQAHAACGGRLMRRDTLHITLAFLGDVPAARLGEAEAAATAVTAAAFVLELDQLAHWRHNRIVWAGCSAPPAALEQLADGLGHCLRDAGFRLEARRFAAHATLLRNATGAALPALDAAIRWPVADFALVASHGGAAGSRYEVLRRWPLAASVD